MFDKIDSLARSKVKSLLVENNLITTYLYKVPRGTLEGDMARLSLAFNKFKIALLENFFYFKGVKK